MPSTLPALTLVDALSEAATRVGATTTDDALRSQAAFVRALVDEVGRYHPSDQRVANLHEQLGEELARLADLAPSGGGAGDSDTDRAGAGGAIDVLLVDDDESSRKAEAAVVRDLGYPCRIVDSAEEALREYDRQPAAIVISDWNMPGMSGLELCAALKRRDPHVYVLLVTGHERAKRLEGIEGVDDFMRKPIDIDELAARLRAAERLVRAVRVVQSVKERLRARATRPDA